MSASSTDIALSIISNEQTAYYSSVKGCGNLIAEVDFGIYSGANPQALKALKFTKNTDWEDCIEKRKSPLKTPLYGSLDIDFDLKEVRYNNSYAPPNFFYFDWVYRSVQDALVGAPSYITSKSIMAHIKNKRIKYYTAAGDEPVDFSSPMDLKNYLDELSSLKNHYALYALIDLPPNWKLIDEGDGDSISEIEEE